VKIHLPGDIDVYARYGDVFVIIRSAKHDEATMQLRLSQHYVEIIMIRAHFTVRVQRLLFNDACAG